MVVLEAICTVIGSKGVIDVPFNICIGYLHSSGSVATDDVDQKVNGSIVTIYLLSCNKYK